MNSNGLHRMTQPSKNRSRLSRKQKGGKHDPRRSDLGWTRRWTGRVFMNPPYGPETGKWLARLADHGDGIALIFARTETEMFHRHGWQRADAMLFLRGRLHFHSVDGARAAANAGAPSV